MKKEDSHWADCALLPRKRCSAPERRNGPPLAGESCLDTAPGRQRLAGPRKAPAAAFPRRAAPRETMPGSLSRGRSPAGRWGWAKALATPRNLKQAE